MKKIEMVLGAVLLTAFVITGCEWGGVTDDVSGGSGGTGGGTSTNKPPGGGTSTNTIPGGGGGTNDTGSGFTQEAVYSEQLEWPDEPGTTAYSGHLDHVLIVEGSMRVRAGGFYFVDDGGGHLVGITTGTRGTIEYVSGSWSLNLGGNDIEAGDIAANYIYLKPVTP